MSVEQLIFEALCLPTNALDYHVSQRLTALFPGKALVESNNPLFDLEVYAEAKFCEVKKKTSVYNQVISNWESEDKGIVERAKNAWFEVRWQGRALDVLSMRWEEGISSTAHYWILSDFKEMAEDFLVAVCDWNMEVRGEVLVFESGCWSKDGDLFKAIKGATFDNLILQGTLKEDIRADLTNFFAARATYEQYNVPWKRGVLLVGPPGNGKTHAVKAIINALGLPCLYVKSFKAEYLPEENNISQVFKRARKAAPCILVMEDLDSLVTDQNRSFFLNELDGFAVNAGIVTLATTNHPELLDPSIIDRPSRFDRKYHFELPAIEERLAYVQMWNMALQTPLQLSEIALAQIAELTEGFSFAYLKELFLSSMMRWIANPVPGTMEEIMAGQVTTLYEQMTSANPTAYEGVASDGYDYSAG